MSESNPLDKYMGLVVQAQRSSMHLQIKWPAMRGFVREINQKNCQRFQWDMEQRRSWHLEANKKSVSNGSPRAQMLPSVRVWREQNVESRRWKKRGEWLIRSVVSNS